MAKKSSLCEVYTLQYKIKQKWFNPLSYIKHPALLDAYSQRAKYFKKDIPCSQDQSHKWSNTIGNMEQQKEEEGKNQRKIWKEIIHQNLWNLEQKCNKELVGIEEEACLCGKGS